MKLPLIFRVMLMGIVPVFVLVYLSISVLRPTPGFNSITEERTFWEKRREIRKAAELDLLLIQQNKKDFEVHATFARHYAALTPRDRSLLQPHVKAVLGNAETYYLNLKKTAQRDIGLYAWVMLQYPKMYKDRFGAMLLALDSISSPTLPYVNELRGDLMRETGGDFINAYRAEWRINPHNVSNYRKLLFSLVQNNLGGEAATVLTNGTNHGIFLTASEQHYIALHLDTVLWLYSIYAPVYLSFFSTGGIMALLIFVVWAVMVWKADVFGEIKWTIKTAATGIALVICPACMGLYDFVEDYLQWTPDSVILREIFNTGLIEEFTKLLPVLICWLLFRKAFDAPVVFFLIASLVSLVFAFQENILYFAHYYDLTIASGRAILSAALHLVTGSVVVYGMIMVLFAGRHFLFIPLCFFVAMTLHGLYNFFLLTGFGVLSVILVVAGIFAWGSMLNNCLNNSPRFNDNNTTLPVNSSIILVTGLSAIVLFEFLFTAFLYGYENGREVFAESLGRCARIIPVIAISFNRLDLEKAQWRFIDFAGFREISLFGQMTGKKIVCVSPAGNSLMGPGTTFTATVVKKLYSAGDDVWYLLNTDYAGMPMALVKFKEYGANFYDFNELVLLRKTDEMPATPLNLKEHPFLGYLVISPVTAEQV